MLYYYQEVRTIKNITLRVSDDFHYSAKTFATKQNITLQKYMIDVVESDLRANNAFIKAQSVTEALVNDLSEEEVLELVKQIKEKRKGKK